MGIYIDGDIYRSIFKQKKWKRYGDIIIAPKGLLCGKRSKNPCPSPRPRPSVCPRFSVVSSKPTSTRDMIFTFIYSSQWKKLDFRAVQIFEDRTKYRPSFSIKVFKKYLFSYLFSVQLLKDYYLVLA